MMEANLTSALGLTLLHYLWQALLIGLVYGFGRLLLHKATANTRYLWALVIFLGLTLTPIATFNTLLAPADSTLGGATVVVESQRMIGDAATATDNSGAHWSAHLHAVLPWVVAAWIAGVLVISLRLVLGWHQLLQLRRTASDEIPAWQRQTLQRLSRQFRVLQRVRLAASKRVHGPILIGSLKPLILLPTALVSGLTPQQVEMVLAHELAHLRRLDHWVNILQTAVETLFFYHPVVRWVSRDLRIEREIACDAMAANLTGDRVGYAETLLKLEQSRSDRHPLAMAMADGQVASRVRRLLYPGRRQGGAVGLSMAALTLVVSALAFGFNDLSEGEDDSLRTAPQPAALEQSLLEQGTQTLTSDGNSGIEASGASSEAPALTSSTSSPMDTVDPIAEAEDLEVAAMEADDPPETTAPAEGAARDSEADDTLADATARPEDNSQPDESEQTTAEPGPDQDTESGIEVPGDAGRDDAASASDTPASNSELDNVLPDQDLQLAELGEIDRGERPEGGTGNAEDSAPPPAETATLSGGELRHQVAPAYPSKARQRGVTGSVELSFTVDTEGRVQQVEILEESPRGHNLGEAAREAVKQWRFEPFSRNGVPVEHRVQTGFDFDDPHDCGPSTGSRLGRC